MDIRAVKQRYGDRICLLGNLDLNILRTCWHSPRRCWHTVSIPRPEFRADRRHYI
jgi:hypothetical protein